MRKFMRRFSAHPLHLLVFIASFAVAGYAALRLIDSRTIAVVVRFVGAALAHDLLPSIARSSDIYSSTTALSSAGYFVRWHSVGVLFLISAVAFAVRLKRAR